MFTVTDLAFRNTLVVVLCTTLFLFICYLNVYNSGNLISMTVLFIQYLRYMWQSCLYSILAITCFWICQLYAQQICICQWGSYIVCALELYTQQICICGWGNLKGHPAFIVKKRLCACLLQCGSNEQSFSGSVKFICCWFEPVSIHLPSPKC